MTDVSASTHDERMRAALAAMKEQLDWRGPTGRPMGHVVLEREHAAVVFAALKDAIEGKAS